MGKDLLALSNRFGSKKYNKEQLLDIQSKTIDCLRFPMAIAVVFIHTPTTVVNLLDADYPLLSVQGIYNIFGVIGSHVLSHIAVPLFFFISGLLFFLNIKTWNLYGYKKKMKSRIHSLVIPYVWWNLLPYLLMLLALLVFGLYTHSFDKLLNFLIGHHVNCFYDCNQWNYIVNWLGNQTVMTGPYNLPLWFLRDLIVMSAITPLIYVLSKRCGLLFILILVLGYLSSVWVSLPGLSTVACLFYSLGAFCSLHNIQIIMVVDRIKWLMLPLTVILFVVSIIADGHNTRLGEQVYPFYVIAMSFSVYYMVSKLVHKYQWKPNKKLTETAFFIFAFHCMPIPVIGSLNALDYKLLHAIIPGSSSLEELIVYLTTPFLTAFLCVFVYHQFKQLFPRISRVLNGSR